MSFAIILLEDDGKTISAVESALDGMDCTVQVCRTGVEAFAVSLQTCPDAVMAGLHMIGDELRRLYVAMRHITRTRSVPFLFLGSPGEFQALAEEGLRIPVDDHLVTPFAAEDLREKVQLLRQIADRGRGGAVAESTETCNIKEMLVDTIEFVAASGRSGTLSARSGSGTGCIIFEGGTLLHASLGEASGEEALLALLALEEVEVSFRERVEEGLARNLDIHWRSFAAKHC